ncbi:unnamed protein product [Durusdinium trenchii]|uniref:Uncharacterized protein n=1 Tax=Durusdinium trenchii TaxID=1381693 RepID=A0ABP0LB84_9DINO
MWDPSEDYATLWADESAFDADGFVTGPGRQPYDWDSNVESGGSFETQKDSLPKDKKVMQLTLQDYLDPDNPDPLFMQNFMYPGEEFGSMVQSSNGSFGMEARSWNRGYRSYQRDGEEGWRPRWYPPKQIDPDDLPPKAVKAGRELRNLLDFYFEPFNLQHNKFLLDLINRKAAASDQVKSVLSKNILASLSFDPEELKGLQRIYAALHPLHYSRCEIAPLDDPAGAGFKVQRRWAKEGNRTAEFALKNLRFTKMGELVAMCSAEVRSFEAAPRVDLEGLVTYFIGMGMEKAEAPKNKFSVVSLNCKAVRENSLPEEAVQQMEGRIRRQAMLYHADVVCIQGLDPENGKVGEGVTMQLTCDNYRWKHFKGPNDEVSIVFFDEHRFKLVAEHEHLGALDLQFCEDEAQILRVASVKALVIAADCLPIGGTEVINMVQEFEDLHSAYMDIGKEEVWTPVGKWDPLARRQRAMKNSISGTLKLHSPDCILCRGVEAIATLAGHRPMYLMTLSPEEAAAQFPTLRMPLLTMFQWPTQAKS